MSAEVVPINYQTEALHTVVGWADELRELLVENKVSALVIRGIDKDGNPLDWTIIPDNAPTLRYMLIGQLQEAVGDLLAARPEPES